MDARRWDTDERGHGVGPGDAFSPNIQELADALPGSGWVTEEPEAHLLPHLRAASDEPGSRDGTVADGSPFVPHGHLIRLRVRPG